MSSPSPLLRGPRVCLWPGSEADVDAIIAFYQANEEHLRATSPPRPALFYDREYWRQTLSAYEASRAKDERVPFFIFARPDENKVIGSVSLSNITRGPFQACYLGYALGEAEQGQGLMREALELAIAYAFEELKLHRIMANYLPTNERSGKLLKRMGFAVEGYARNYLFINGEWRDHVLTSLTNHSLTQTS